MSKLRKSGRKVLKGKQNAQYHAAAAYTLQSLGFAILLII